MEFSFGLSGLVFSYNDYYSCNILISYSKLIMIKNNFFTLIIINIKDNFPLKKKHLLETLDTFLFFIKAQFSHVNDP